MVDSKYFDLLNTAEDVIETFFVSLLLFIIAPFFVRWILNLIIDFFNFLTRQNRWNTLNFANIIRFVAWFGTMVRASLIYITLYMRGWTARITYRVNTSGPQANYGNRREFSGFGIYMTPRDGKPVTFKDMIIVSMVGYLVEIFVILWWVYQEALMTFFLFTWGPKKLTVSFLFINWTFYVFEFMYWFLFITLLIGGLPVPEETMALVYYFFVWYPDVVWMFLFNLLGASVFSTIYGKYIATLLFGISSAIGIYIVLYYKKKLEELQKEGDDIELMDDVMTTENIGLL